MPQKKLPKKGEKKPPKVSTGVDDLIRKHVGLLDSAVLPVLMSVAAAAKGVHINAAKTPLLTTPPNLMDRTFEDPEVGLHTPERMEIWKAGLAHFLPAFHEAIREIPTTPSLKIGDVVRLISALQRNAAATAARESAPMVFSMGPVGEARKKVASLLGTDFASKSSESVLKLLSSPARESMDSASQSAPLILEFERAAKMARPEILSSPAEMRAQRQMRINQEREAFYRQVSAIRMTIEKLAGAKGVQVCWLNASLRAATRHGAIAEVAAAPSLQTVDLPRRLRREMNVAGVTVGAIAFRTRFSRTGRGVRIAVIDGEVNVNHPALLNRVTLQENFTAENFGNPDGHGTAVAGIVGAQDAQLGGMAPEVSIINYKIFPSDPFATADDFDGALAIERALRDGVDIANCSWGAGPATDGTSREARACNRAWDEGLIIVKSAGNQGPNSGTMTTPADADGVIVAGATDRQGTAVQDYSSRGRTSNGKQPHLVTPGGNSANGMMTCSAAGDFGSAGFGTSFAAPIVTGAAALLLEHTPGSTPDTIRDRLIALCRLLPNAAPDTQGAGLLDLSAFV